MGLYRGDLCIRRFRQISRQFPGAHVRQKVRQSRFEPRTHCTHACRVTTTPRAHIGPVRCSSYMPVCTYMFGMFAIVLPSQGNHNPRCAARSVVNTQFFNTSRSYRLITDKNPFFLLTSTKVSTSLTMPAVFARSTHPLARSMVGRIT